MEYFLWESVNTNNKQQEGRQTKIIIKFCQSEQRKLKSANQKMVEIKVCQMLKMYNSNYGFTVETKRVHNITMPFVQKIVRNSFDHFSHYSGQVHWQWTIATIWFLFQSPYIGIISRLSGIFFDNGPRWSAIQTLNKSESLA